MRDGSAVPRAIVREKKTVEAMVAIYCAAHRHDRDGGDLCLGCRELLDYSHRRLDHCPYGDDKPTCQACSNHCYRAQMRERMRQVMREAGPRMLLRHPWLAVVHLWQQRFRQAPPRSRAVRSR